MSTTFISICIDDKAAALIDQMVSTGIYGSDRDLVCEGLVLRGIQKAVGSGIVSFPLPPMFAEVGEDPEKPGWACKHCNDGNNVVADETPDGHCPKCGLNLQIPF